MNGSNIAYASAQRVEALAFCTRCGSSLSLQNTNAYNTHSQHTSKPSLQNQYFKYIKYGMMFSYSILKIIYITSLLNIFVDGDCINVLCKKF